MRSSLKAGACLVLGLALGGTLARGPAAVKSKPARRTGRLIVGMNPPVAPPEVKDLGHLLNAQIVNVSPDGAFVLIMPRRGVTGEQVQRRSDRVVSVDREVVMGLAQPDRELLLVVPMRRLPGRIVGLPPDLRGKTGSAPSRRK